MFMLVGKLTAVHKLRSLSSIKVRLFMSLYIIRIYMFNSAYNQVTYVYNIINENYLCIYINVCDKA